MLDKNNNIIIIGAGIVGLSIARALLIRGYKKVIILEKEDRISKHQSGRNSGVMHAGLYYKPKSLKADLSRKGITLMKEYCDRNLISWRECGKVVVATNQNELDRLEHLFSRGKENGLLNIELLSARQVNNIEPYVKASAGIFVPEESIVNYVEVAESFKKEIEQFGGIIRFNTIVESQSKDKKYDFIKLNGGETISYGTLICCAGLYSDKVSKLFNIDINNKRIIPFRGEYYKLKSEFSYLVKSLIYPVPNPQFPFLGVHFTRMIDDQVEAGPNAVLALAREGYSWNNIKLSEFYDSISYIGLQKFILNYPLTTTGEVIRSLSKEIFLKSLKKIIPDLTSEMIVKGGAGIRAQLMNTNGGLEQDFDIRVKDNCISILNAPSPAATSSLSIAEYVLDLIN